MNAEDLARNSRLTWVAGYEEKVGWVQSSVMDLYFWHAYFSSTVASERNREARAARMLTLLACLYIRVPSMFDELGFRVTLEFKTGYITISKDFWLDDDNRDVLDDAKSWIEVNPGDWP